MGFKGTDLPQTAATSRETRINNLCILKQSHTSTYYTKCYIHNPEA